MPADDRELAWRARRGAGRRRRQAEAVRAQGEDRGSVSAYPAMPLNDALDTQRRAMSGDAEANAFFNSLFEQDAPCFACDEPIGMHVTVQLLSDLRDKRQMLILPICGTCGALPALYLRHRVTKMAKAMWPAAGFWRATTVRKV